MNLIDLTDDAFNTLALEVIDGEGAPEDLCVVEKVVMVQTLQAIYTVLVGLKRVAPSLTAHYRVRRPCEVEFKIEHNETDWGPQRKGLRQHPTTITVDWNNTKNGTVVSTWEEVPYGKNLYTEDALKSIVKFDGSPDAMLASIRATIRNRFYRLY